MTTASPNDHHLHRARALIERHLVWDNHGCMPVGRPHDTSFLPQLRRYRDSGVDVVMLNIGFGDMSVEDHLRTLASLRAWLLERPDEYQLIRRVSDIDEARAAGRLAVGFDIEGANAIGDQLSLLRLYRDLGVRWMLLAYNRANRTGGGCQEDDPGLSDFGRDVVREMERIGLQVCCSHTGHRTSFEVIEAASRPVIFSHSNASAVHAHPRNIPDALIRACAAGGGVVGLNGIGTFLGPPQADLVQALVRHVDHVAQLVGPQHVALGLDHVFDLQEVQDYVAKMRHTFPGELGYDGTLRLVAPEQLLEVVDGLLGRGWDEPSLAMLLGDNLRRLAMDLEQAQAG